ncbi:MAG: hypothetical protein U1E81_14820 [Xanthobacteraceae bacterium]
MANPTFSADALWGDRYVTELVPDWGAGNRKIVDGNSTVILTPPPGCKKVQIFANSDLLVRIDGRPADALSQLIPGNTVTVIDVTENVPVTAVCVSGQADVFATPMRRKDFDPPTARQSTTLSGGVALSADSFKAIVLQSSSLKGNGGHEVCVRLALALRRDGTPAADLQGRDRPRAARRGTYRQRPVGGAALSNNTDSSRRSRFVA